MAGVCKCDEYASVLRPINIDSNMVMTYIVMDYMVYIVLAYIVMDCIVMA